MTLGKPTAKAFVEVDGRRIEDAAVLDVVQVTGGRKVNRASWVLQEEFSAARGTSRFRDGYLREFFADTGVVRIIIDADNDPRCVHIGRIVGGQARLTEKGELWIQSSRLDEAMLGIPMVQTLGITHRVESEFPHLSRQTTAQNSVALVMNPLIDGIPTPNRQSDPIVPFFVDADGLLYGDGKDLTRFPGDRTTGDIEPWTLASAIAYFCDTLNDAKYVENPTFAELKEFQGGVLNIQIQQFVVRPQDTLPRILDRLLKPYGHTWFVNFETEAIEIITRASSRKLVLEADPFEHSLEWDHVDATASNVVVLGGYARKEGTFELVPAWDPIYDDYSIRQLSKESEEWENEPESRRAWRDWVLNENGDYNGIRDTIFEAYEAHQFFHKDSPSIDFPINVDSDRGHRKFKIPIESIHRRRFFPTLTLGPDGKPIGENNGVYIEYFDGVSWKPVVASSDSTSSAKGVPNGKSFQILKDECGIRWNANDISSRLKRIGLENLKLRVTATLESDFRIMGQENRAGHYQDELWYVVPDNDSFRWARVDQSSTFFSRLQDGTHAADEINDTDRIEQFARNLWDNMSPATIKGNIQIHGIESDVGIRPGDQIKSIDENPDGIGSANSGGPLQLDAQIQGAAQQSFPRVVQITYDVQNQVTKFSLESSRGFTT